MTYTLELDHDELLLLNVAVTWLVVESRKNVDFVHEDERTALENDAIKIQALLDKLQKKLGEDMPRALAENIAAWQKRELALDAKSADHADTYPFPFDPANPGKKR